jgi:hypothetical protein
MNIFFWSIVNDSIFHFSTFSSLPIFYFAPNLKVSLVKKLAGSGQDNDMKY